MYNMYVCFVLPSSHFLIDQNRLQLWLVNLVVLNYVQVFFAFNFLFKSVKFSAQNSIKDIWNREVLSVHPYWYYKWMLYEATILFLVDTLHS